MQTTQFWLSSPALLTPLPWPRRCLRLSSNCSLIARSSSWRLRRMNSFRAMNPVNIRPTVPNTNTLKLKTNTFYYIFKQNQSWYVQWRWLGITQPTQNCILGRRWKHHWTDAAWLQSQLISGQLKFANGRYETAITQYLLGGLKSLLANSQEESKDIVEQRIADRLVVVVNHVQI